MLRYKVSVKNKHTIVTKRNTLQISIFFLLTSLLLLPGHASAAESITDKTLIVYYSRTAKSKLVCEVLQQHINADILEVKDLKDRSGQWGYYSAGLDSVFNRYTQIEPESPDFSPYSSIIVISPVWNWKLSVPIRTLIHKNKNKFNEKKMIFITTGNNEVTKYEKYGDDATFIQRYLRDYLRNKCEGMKSFVKSSGCEITGYYHVATLEKTDQQITDKTLSFISGIEKKLSHNADSSTYSDNR